MRNFTARIAAGLHTSRRICATHRKSKPLGKEYTMSSFDHIAASATVKNGIREITYEQFQEIRNSKENYILLDVLTPEHYNAGHIEGALSFPVYDINNDNAAKKLSKDAKIVVYCANFHCSASTNAARELAQLGYDVLDYKGGIKEWKEKGNGLIK
jgi:rhodanese-related sulfurtransferase